MTTCPILPPLILFPPKNYKDINLDFFLVGTHAVLRRLCYTLLRDIVGLFNKFEKDITAE